MLRSMTGDVRGVGLASEMGALRPRDLHDGGRPCDPGDRRQLDEGPFDVAKAYEAMRRPRRPVRRTACGPTSTPISRKGLYPAGVLRQRPCGRHLRSPHALEYYMADAALSLPGRLARQGRRASVPRPPRATNAITARKAVLCVRSILTELFKPPRPEGGRELHGGSGSRGGVWNYTFYVPHDGRGLRS